MATAGRKRRADFSTGRDCAREALSVLGIDPVAILKGMHGEPIWPEGVVGSLTHCRGYYGAVVAWDEDVRSIGIDAEPHVGISEEALEAIARPEELAHAQDEVGSGIHVGKVLFCAKEAVYKAWFPVARTKLSFLDVFVRLASGGTFSVSACGDADVGGVLPALDGRWRVTSGLVLSGAILQGNGSESRRGI